MMRWIADCLVIIIFAAGIYLGSKKSPIHILKHLGILITSIFVSYTFMPLFASILKKKTLFYVYLKTLIGKAMHLREITEQNSLFEQREFLKTVDIPSVLQKELLYNHNTEIYHLFNVNNATEYVYGFLANVVLNTAVFFFVIFFVYIMITSFVEYFLGEKISDVQIPFTSFVSGVLSAILSVAYLMVLSLGVVFMLLSPKLNLILFDMTHGIAGWLLYDQNPLFWFVQKIII